MFGAGRCLGLHGCKEEILCLADFCGMELAERARKGGQGSQGLESWDSGQVAAALYPLLWLDEPMRHTLSGLDANLLCHP